jgi:hypothetical protein
MHGLKHDITFLPLISSVDNVPILYIGCSCKKMIAFFNHPTMTTSTARTALTTTYVASKSDTYRRLLQKPPKFISNVVEYHRIIDPIIKNGSPYSLAYAGMHLMSWQKKIACADTIPESWEDEYNIETLNPHPVVPKPASCQCDRPIDNSTYWCNVCGKSLCEHCQTYMCDKDRSLQLQRQQRIKQLKALDTPEAREAYMWRPIK